MKICACYFIIALLLSNGCMTAKKIRKQNELIQQQVQIAQEEARIKARKRWENLLDSLNYFRIQQARQDSFRRAREMRSWIQGG